MCSTSNPCFSAPSRKARHSSGAKPRPKRSAASGPIPLPFRSARSRGWTQVLLFGAKDSWVRGSQRRHPAARAFPWAVLLLALAGLALAPVVQDPGSSARPGVAEVLAVALLMLASRQTLGTLGIEGSTFPLLAVILPKYRLYGVKCLVNLGYLLSWGSLYALALGLVGSRLPSYDSDMMYLITSVFMYSIALSVFGTGLGFLLPDFKCRSLLLPGSTRSAQLGFLILSPVLATGAMVSALLESAGVHSGLAQLGGQILPSVTLILASLPVVGLAVAKAGRVAPRFG